MGSAARWGKALSAQEELELAARILDAERRATAAIRRSPMSDRLDRNRPRTERTRAGDVDVLAQAIDELRQLAKTDGSVRVVAREARGALDEAEALRWTLAMSGARIAAGEARKIAGPFLDIEDLIQEGFVGLWRAAKRFEPSRKLRFSTYARWWVRAQLTRAVDNTGRTVRLPGCAVEQRRNLRKLMDSMDSEGTGWTLMGLAKEMSLEPERVAFLLNQGRTSSLDESVDDSERDGRTIGAMLADEDAEDPAEAVVAHQEVARLHDGVDALLSERQRYVLTHRYGLGGLDKRSLASIGRSLQLSRERVRQIEIEALRTMRQQASIRA
jgi:RNA polymerase primary sigma factor